MISNTARLPLVGLCLLLGACSGATVRDLDTPRQMAEAFELEAGAGGQPPAAISAALLPPLKLQLPGLDEGEAEPHFAVKVRRLRARDFFLSLVDGTPYNVVIHPKVTGYVSLDLKETTVPEVMRVVRSVLGYDYTIKGKTIQVYPNTMHTRLFRIDYPALTRTGESLTTSKTGQITVASDSSGSSGSSNSSSIQTGSSADYWTELKGSLETLIGSDDGRRISVNTQTGVVAVRALPSEMRIIEEYLESSQDILHRQVVLEARILEVTLNDRFQSGINWAALHESGNRSVFGGQFGASTMLDSGYSELVNQTNVLDPSNSSAVRGLVTSSMGGAFSMAVDGGGFTAFIELLKTQGDVQVLSSPRVSTINNQKAVIKVGDDEFFVTNIETDTNTATTGGTTSVSVSLDPFFSGVALDVIPQISKGGDIVLHVHPAVSEVREQTKTVATSMGNLSMPLAASNIRESDTVIRAANSQVVVIGGLMQNKTEDEQGGIPVLGDLPLLGGLFSHTRKTTRKSELVILLKPTIVDANGRVWQQELGRSSSTIREMNERM